MKYEKLHPTKEMYPRIFLMKKCLLGDCPGTSKCGVMVKLALVSARNVNMREAVRFYKQGNFITPCPDDIQEAHKRLQFHEVACKQQVHHLVSLWKKFKANELLLSITGKRNFLD